MGALDDDAITQMSPTDLLREKRKAADEDTSIRTGHVLYDLLQSSSRYDPAQHKKWGQMRQQFKFVIWLIEMRRIARLEMQRTIGKVRLPDVSEDGVMLPV